MSKILAFVGTSDDESYLHNFKALVGTAKVYLRLDEISTLTELELWAKKRNITGIFLTQKHLLKKLVGVESRANPSLDDYQGSLISRNGIEYVILNPLEHLVRVNYAKFTFERFVSKLTKPETWKSTDTFSWKLYEPANVTDAYEKFGRENTLTISIDIETSKDPLRITCVSYTALSIESDSSLTTSSYVIPIKDEYALAWVKKFNSLPAPKIFQNGKYDNSYFLMYGAPVYNWLFDTANAFHSWLSELPKDLGFLGAFFVRDAMYWKDLAKTGDLMDYYLYNAKDSWTTLWVFIFWLLEAPDWAKRNYLKEFPLNFPCLLAEMTGIKRDEEVRKQAYAETEIQINQVLGELQRSIGKPFNPNSPKQCQTLLKILGVQATSTDEKNLKRFALLHPFIEYFCTKILKIRKLRKENSTYLVEGKEYHGRTLYALNPHATDTSRLASREHHFWCGLQIHNITRGPSVKRTFRADEDFYFGECDLEQAESRDTGYISGDDTLIANVSGERDFHSLNASAFFGLDYNELYDDERKKTKNKPIRDVAKKVNHGANYNMGASVLVDTMGIDKIREAQILLKLPRHWNPKRVAEYLLDRFEATYPKLKGQWYESIIQEILTTNLLVSRAYHHVSSETRPESGNSPIQFVREAIQVGGWTRYCFGRPDKNKSDLNSYVAHPPQSLNAQTLNIGWLRVFYEIALHPVHSKNFRLLAQIHDSILFLYRRGHEYLCQMVKERMEIPVTVLGADKVYRTFTVPAAIKIGNPGALYWNETGD